MRYFEALSCLGLDTSNESIETFWVAIAASFCFESLLISEILKSAALFLSYERRSWSIFDRDLPTLSTESNVHGVTAVLPTVPLNPLPMLELLLF